MKPVIVILPPPESNPEEHRLVALHNRFTQHAIQVASGVFVVQDSVVFDHLWHAAISDGDLREDDEVAVFGLRELALGNFPEDSIRKLQSLGLETFPLHIPRLLRSTTQSPE